MIIDGNFVFRKPRIGNPSELLFNDETDPALNVSVVIDATLPALSAEILLKQTIKYEAQADITLSPLSSDCTLQYVSGAARPLVGKAESSWSTASSNNIVNQNRYAENLKNHAVDAVPWSQAQRCVVGVQSIIKHTMLPSRTERTIDNQAAAHVITRSVSHWQQLSGTSRLAVSSRAQNAIPVAAQVMVRHQVMLMGARPQTRHHHAEMIHHAQVVGQRMSVGIPLNDRTASRYQDARKAPLGKLKPVVPPIVKPDYTPSSLLLFYELFGDYRDLLFQRTPTFVQTIVVPVKRSYIVINDSTLTNITTGESIPAVDMSMTIDMDSWTWGFSATIPDSAYGSVARDSSGNPPTLEAVINGVPYRVIAESISRSRAFGKSTYSVTGRGISAELSDSYVPVMSFGNAATRTAQQLMNDVLTLNGQPIGWTIDWKIDDWLVAAGTFSHQGSYMSAINSIAQSAGAFISPDNANRILRVMPRMPAPHWLLENLTPEIVLPSDPVIQESTTWEKRPAYDSIYVSGTTSAGVLAKVHKTGSGGINTMPMVTDPLITDVIAARQRGISELSKSGSVVNYQLNLPILAETGIITPGKVIRYVDNGNLRTGLSKSVSVNVALPTARQTINIVTYD